MAAFVAASPQLAELHGPGTRCFQRLRRRERDVIGTARTLLLTSAFLTMILWATASQGGILYTNLFSFAGTNGDTPIGTLIQGKDGQLYGVTQMGGAMNAGTVFKMALDGTLTTLASFADTNGAGPHAGLVEGADGNFYGTTMGGGQYRDAYGNPGGTVFRITPEGVLTSLVSFNDTNGLRPDAELVQGPDGNLYGTTHAGGEYRNSHGDGGGTIFKVSPSGVLTTLVSFNETNGAGYAPWCALTPGADGNFYGMARAGGDGGCGTIFRMTPAGALTTVLSFDCTNGAGSLFGLVRGAAGDLYGAGELGGTYWCGTVYRVTANGVLSTLASFNGTNGAYVRGITQASDGNLYGMTQSGGVGYNGQSYSGNGTVFQVTPGGTITALVSFTNSDWAFGKLVQANDGNLYGMTRHGGDYGRGRIFRLSVPMPPVLQSLDRTGATITLTWSAVSGQRYQVQCRTNLTQTNWTSLGAPSTATNGTATACDVIGSDSQQLYRVVLLQ